MSSKDKDQGSKLIGTGSCLRPGIPESDTADSGEESEPTYRHYDNFETDVCLTQDEDDEEPLASNIPIVRDIVGDRTPTQKRKCSNDSAQPREGSSGREIRDSIPRDNFGIVTNMSRGMSSDSDSCTETEGAAPGVGGQTTTDDTTTSTSESEETQIWVPVSKRPSAVRQIQDTTTPPASATSSNGSDNSRPQSFIHKAGTPGPRAANSAGSLAIMTSPTSNGYTDRSVNGGISSDNTIRREDSWQNLQSNTQSSGVQKRVSPTKQVSLSLLRHDQMTGTITLDIRNLPNGESGLSHDDGRFSPSDEAGDLGVSGSMLRHGQVSTTQQRHQSFADTVCLLGSGLYMLLVVITGIVVAGIFAVHQYPALFEGFYIYLHVISISFLVYAYTYILRIRALPSKRRRTIVSSVPVPNRNRNQTSDDVTETQTGSFYLRLGAVGFGVGSMINSGLHFGEYFELMSSPFCSEVLFGIRPLLHLCFTFAQLYFVFLNAKMYTHRYRQLARFGLMHMIAANLCVWWENVVKETLRDLNRDQWTPSDDSNVTAMIQEIHPNSDCYLTSGSLMGDVVNSSGPYLYPCTILYSLICSSILLVMWLKLDNKGPVMQRQLDGSGSSERSHVDCSSSSRGLFLGIIVFVAAVIVLITFSVLVRSREFITAAVRLGHIGDVTMYVMTSVSVIIAFHRMYVLKPIAGSSLGFEDALMVLSLVGVYMLSVSNIIAGILAESQRYGHLLIISSCFRLIQATIQTMFLMNATRRRAWKKDQEVNKAGREFVTFLLICNIAFWGLNLFEVQRADANPIQETFYGSVGWSIITHVSVPLSIFFRFHSTVCLANIWKHAWRYVPDTK